jgi:hypothetical protein
MLSLKFISIWKFSFSAFIFIPSHMYVLVKHLFLTKNKQCCCASEHFWWGYGKQFWLYIVNFFDGTGIWSQGSTLAREVHYRLSHSTSPFCFSYFWDRISHFCFSWSFCLCLLHSCDYKYTLPLSALLVELVGGGVSLTFCPGWSWTVVLPISTSQVTGVTGMSHNTWLMFSTSSIRFLLFVSVW